MFGFYDMGISQPSKFYLINNDKEEAFCIDLGNINFSEQMKKLAAVIQENRINEIYISTKAAFPLEHILNNELIKNYSYDETNLIKFIYKEI